MKLAHTVTLADLGEQEMFKLAALKAIGDAWADKTAVLILDLAAREIRSQPLPPPTSKP